MVEKLVLDHITFPQYENKAIKYVAILIDYTLIGI